MTGERNKIIWGEIVARAWRDQAFKQDLIAAPKMVLTNAGMTVPDGVELQIIEDTPTTRHLIFPVSPAGGGQKLDEDQLELVAGGGTGATTNTVQTVGAVTTEVQTAETAATSVATMVETSATAIVVVV